MKIFRRATDLQAYLSNLRTNNRSVGFVPTMGALHQGHLSLVERSRKENQVTVVSIFVNPTQFNDATDLEKYPRTPGKDIELLSSVGCEVVFLPSVTEVYPKATATNSYSIDFGALDKVMEGAMRPGHFVGVAQVVQRLLELTIPDRLYMGQKDFQQLAIVKSMIKQRNISVQLISCPTSRDTDGVALSSRNVRLSEEMRQKAPILYKTMESVKQEVLSGASPAAAAQRAKKTLDDISGFRAEYVEIFDGDTLQPIDDAKHKSLVIALAVWAEDVRLIDNLIIR